jgi:AAA-like domain
MADTLRASQKGLETVAQAGRKKRWTKTRTPAWWDAAYTTQATLRRFWRRIPIQRDTFIAICQAVGVENWEEIVDSGDISQTDIADAGFWVDLELPLNSTFYIERTPIEERCYQTLAKSGALIRIKAPRQMGKTSLLERILERATQQGYRTARLNLLQAETTVFSNLDIFLRWCCTCASQKLKLPIAIAQNWHPDRGSIVNCTTYMQEQILEQLDSPFVLALDEVDRVFQFPEIARDFFPMLRSWHEEAKTIEIWENLRLLVVHSTEDYGSLDINQSPFNVGLPIELPEFTPAQVLDLAKRHRLNWSETEVEQLIGMIGGHPYLVRLALYHLVDRDITLEELLLDAPTDAGIYEEHLRRHWNILQENPPLGAAFKQVVNAFEPVRIETILAYKLYSMGLIKRVGDRVMSRCKLYEHYFQARL